MKGNSPMTFALLPLSSFNPMMFDGVPGRLSGEQSPKPEEYKTRVLPPYIRKERKPQGANRNHTLPSHQVINAQDPQSPDAGRCVERSYNPIPIAVHLSQARLAIECLVRFGQRAQRERQHDEEMSWLAGNRNRFAGRWIALDGDRLLAVGRTSKEVFSAVADHTPPPLVIQIEESELPFAGW
jgi:hypothetical protein